MPTSPAVLTRLRQSFELLKPSRHKEVGLRALLDAQRFFQDNPELAGMRLQTAEFHLAFARKHH